MMRIYGIIAVLILMSISSVIGMPTDEGPINIIVKEKWSKVISDGESVRGLYLFSTTSGDVYSIEDTIWHMDFNAADRYAMLEEGKSYRIWLFGMRIPFMSMYQNAYKIEEM